MHVLWLEWYYLTLPYLSSLYLIIILTYPTLLSLHHFTGLVLSLIFSSYLIALLKEGGVEDVFVLGVRFIV